MEAHVSHRKAEGKPFLIYALVCPITLEVKYVGQTKDLNRRTRAREHSGHKSSAVKAWLDSLGYLRPYRVILERGINRIVRVPHSEKELERQRAASRRGRPYNYDTGMWLSSCLETKWMKRFRRTILNPRPKQSTAAYDALRNPPLPWDEAVE